MNENHEIQHTGDDRMDVASQHMQHASTPMMNRSILEQHSMENNTNHS